MNAGLEHSVSGSLPPAVFNYLAPDAVVVDEDRRWRGRRAALLIRATANRGSRPNAEGTTRSRGDNHSANIAPRYSRCRRWLAGAGDG